MARPLRFEPFDAAPQVAATTGPSEDWRAGHASGLAEAAAAATARRAAAEDAALAALGDLAFTWAEARAAILAALAPLFATLAERLVPELAAGAFPLHLVDELARAASGDVAVTPHLHLSPRDCDHVAPLLAAAGFSGVRLHADTSLAPGQARLGRGAGFTALDVPALVAALQDVTAAFLAAADPAGTADADAAFTPETPQTEGQFAHG